MCKKALCDSRSRENTADEIDSDVFFKRKGQREIKVTPLTLKMIS